MAINDINDEFSLFVELVQILHQCSSVNATWKACIDSLIVEAQRENWSRVDELLTEILDTIPRNTSQGPMSELRSLLAHTMALDDNKRSQYLSSTLSLSDAKDSQKVAFLVHGHDLQLLDQVKSALIEFGYKPKVLKDMPVTGMQAIFNLLLSTSFDLGIVLLTADDVGRSNNDIALRPRARQNVIFEAGWLIGKLGPEKVILIRDEEVEVFSDILGVKYISRRTWLNELRNALNGNAQ